MPSLPKFGREADNPLVGLQSDVNYIKGNKRNYSNALNRFNSINKKYNSMKTAQLEQSYNKFHKKGSLPEFYSQYKLKAQKKREDEERRQTEEIEQHRTR